MKNRKSSASRSLSLLRPKEIVSLVQCSSRLTPQNSSPLVSKKSSQLTLLRISSVFRKKCFRYAWKSPQKKNQPAINRKWKQKFVRCGKTERIVNSVLIAPLLMASTSLSRKHTSLHSIEWPYAILTKLAPATANMDNAASLVTSREIFQILIARKHGIKTCSTRMPQLWSQELTQSLSQM